MRLLFFLLRTKAANFINRNKNIGSLLMNLGTVTFALLNAVLVSLLLNYLYSKRQPDSIDSVVQLLNSAIFILPILMLFVPSFRGKIVFFKKTDPIYPVKRSVIEVVYNLVSSSFLIPFLAISIIFFTAVPFTVNHAALSLKLILLSSLCCLIIQSVADIEDKWKIVLAIVLGIIIAIVVFFKDHFSINHITAYSIPFLLLAYHFMQFLQGGEKEEKQITEYFESNLRRLLTNVYFKTKSIQINLALALTFKILFLFILLSKPGNSNFLYLKLFQWLLISSLLFFTYIHNNTWGYLKTTYKMIAQAKDVSLLFKGYIVFLAIPISLDFVITGSLITFFKRPSVAEPLIYFSFYLLTLMNNILIGVYSSLSMPIEIKKSLDFTSFKSNTSLGANLASVFSTALICFLFISGSGGYFLPLYLIVLSYFYYQLIYRKGITKYMKSGYNIF